MAFLHFHHWTCPAKDGSLTTKKHQISKLKNQDHLPPLGYMSDDQYPLYAVVVDDDDFYDDDDDVTIVFVIDDYD